MKFAVLSSSFKRKSSWANAQMSIIPLPHSCHLLLHPLSLFSPQTITNYFPFHSKPTTTTPLSVSWRYKAKLTRPFSATMWLIGEILPPPPQSACSVGSCLGQANRQTDWYWTFISHRRQSNVCRPSVLETNIVPPWKLHVWISVRLTTL